MNKIQNISSLFIGSMLIHNGFPVQVIQLMKGNIVTVGHQNGIELNVPLDKLEGVPITHEILISNGFECIPDGKFGKIHKYAFNLPNKEESKKYFYDVELIALPEIGYSVKTKYNLTNFVQYFHELQMFLKV